MKKTFSFLTPLIVTVGMLSTGFAANAIEYGAIVTEMSGCVSTVKANDSWDKSPLNNKPLVQMCHLCIGLQSEGTTSAYLVTSMGNTDYGLNGCLSDTDLSPQFVSDYSSLCNSRGGTIITDFITTDKLIACLFYGANPL